MATFHENLVQSFHNFRDKYLKANGNFFKFSYDTTTEKYGFTINGTFHPFKSVQASKTVTASTSSQTVTPDSGYDGIASVTVNPTPSQTKSASFGTSAQTISPDSGKLLSSVSISAISPQRSAGTAIITSGLDELGPYIYFPYGWYPYLGANGCFIRGTQAQMQAAHAHTGTRANVTSNGTIDLGEIHNIRYVPVSVTSTHNPSNIVHNTKVIGTPGTTNIKTNGGAGTYIVVLIAINNQTYNISVNSVSTSNGTLTLIDSYTFTEYACGCAVAVYKLVTTGNATVTYTYRWCTQSLLFKLT